MAKAAKVTIVEAENIVQIGEIDPRQRAPARNIRGSDRAIYSGEESRDPKTERGERGKPARKRNRTP